MVFIGGVCSTKTGATEIMGWVAGGASYFLISIYLDIYNPSLVVQTSGTGAPMAIIPPQSDLLYNCLANAPRRSGSSNRMYRSQTTPFCTHPINFD